MKKFPFVLFSVLVPIGRASTEASQIIPHPGSVGTSLLSMVFTLFSLLFVLLGLYWFSKRFLIKHLRAKGPMQSMHVLSVTMVGPKEKIVMLDSGEGNILVVGVTPQHISLLDKRTHKALDKLS